MVNIPPKATCRYISSFPFAINYLNYFPRNLRQLNIGKELHDLSKKNPSSVIKFHTILVSSVIYLTYVCLTSSQMELWSCPLRDFHHR